MSGRPPRWYVTLARLVRAVWGSSLPLRVIIMTMVASIFVLLLGGFVYLNQAKNDLVEAKKQASVVEARGALYRMQNQLDDTDLASDSLLERLGQLASEVGSQPSQFSVMLRRPPAAICRVAQSDSVPDSFVRRWRPACGVYVTLTQCTTGGT